MISQAWLARSLLLPVSFSVNLTLGTFLTKPSVLGGSSGIGLAAVRLLLDLEALVVVGDKNPMPITHDALAFQETDVGSWSDLQALLNKAIQLHGRIDHVFANAGITGPHTRYLDDAFDQETGALLEPTTITLDINLKAVINTAYLGMHHMRHQPEPQGGSIVCTTSSTCIQRFRYADYAISKHGVLGFMRGVVPNIQARGLPLRVNCIAPSLTNTGMVNDALFAEVGYPGWVQPAEAPARSALLLMADESRQGQMIYSARSEFWEIEESRLLPVALEILNRGTVTDDVIMNEVAKHAALKAEEQKKAEAEAEVNKKAAEEETGDGKASDHQVGKAVTSEVV